MHYIYPARFNWNLYKVHVLHILSQTCCNLVVNTIVKGEKEGDLTQSYDKTPYTNRKFKNQRTTHKSHQNFDYTTIADDLGRSVGVATVIKLVWLNRFTGTQPSH